MECGVCPDIQIYSTNIIRNQGREGGDLIAILMIMAVADDPAQGEDVFLTAAQTGTQYHTECGS